jgi:hypothetical protein
MSKPNTRTPMSNQPSVPCQSSSEHMPDPVGQGGFPRISCPSLMPADEDRWIRCHTPAGMVSSE